jgi:O-antigen/teichoic acid export membrane protein
MIPAAASRLLRRHRHLNAALVDQALVSATNFLAAILMVRALGLEEFGRFVIAWMAVQLAQSLQTALVVRPMMSIGPKQAADETEGYFGAVLLQQLALTAMLASLLLLGALGLGLAVPAWGSGALALPVAAAAALHLVQDHARRTFFTRGAHGRALASDLARCLPLLGLLGLLLLHEAPTAALALWAQAAASGAGAALALVLWLPTRLRAGRLGEVARRHWAMARWLFGSTLLEWTQGQLMTLIAALVIGAGAAGAIRATQNLVGVTHLLFEGLQNVVPIQAGQRCHEGGGRALARYTLRATGLIALATALIVAVIVAAPGFWLALFYGDRLAGYERLLYWHGLTYVLMTPGLPLTAALNALERTRSVFTAQLAGSAVTVAFGYPIAVAFGLDGVMLMGALLQLLRQSVMAAGLLRELGRAEACS